MTKTPNPNRIPGPSTFLRGQAFPVRLCAACAGTILLMFFVLVGVVAFRGVRGFTEAGVPGLWSAILGTALMILLMSIAGLPLGVVTAIYLREYARPGPTVKFVRLALANLAGTPAVVYGMFGLALFVHGLGGHLDTLFFSQRLPTPTFGTGGLFWASLTMALLTVPAVILAVEKGLNEIPDRVRFGSMALGATRFQTLIRVILPMSSPGILTGLISAVTRAAGEVTPLLLLGMAAGAPLPLDGDFPFLHLEGKFSHLGYLIYEAAFHPRGIGARDTVYFAALVLLFLVFSMTGMAMFLRRKLKRHYYARRSF